MAENNGAPALEETERGFLIDPEVAAIVLAGRAGTRLEQVYLSNDPMRAVRVRVAGDEAWLTVKGPKCKGSGIEVELAMDVVQARALKPLALGRPVEKDRFLVPLEGGFVGELDVFVVPEGYLRIEVEFKGEGAGAAAAAYVPPAWFGAEVTDDPRFSNMALAFGDLPPVAPTSADTLAARVAAAKAAFPGA